MREKSIEPREESRAEWDTLEAFARQGVQRLLQRVLEEEVDELLGRGHYERRSAIDAPLGYRNGFGRERRLSLSSGTITLWRLRMRELTERGSDVSRRCSRTSRAAWFMSIVVKVVVGSHLPSCPNLAFPASTPPRPAS